MLRVDLRTSLDEAVLAEILDLIEEARRIEGHAPVGEHKLSHLALAATGGAPRDDWVGILAYDAYDAYDTDTAADGRGGRGGRGDRLVGYAHTRWNAPGARPRLAVEVVVHPGWHGLGVARRLLDETRGVLARAGGGLLYLWVHRVEDAADTLAARMGFAVQRDLALMARDLADPPVPLPPPEGVTLRAYRPGADDDALLAVNNAAFPDHPENGGWDRADLAERTALPWFDPAGVILADGGANAGGPGGGADVGDAGGDADTAGGLLGFHWTKLHAHADEDPPPHAPVGEVYVLAVSPRAQGRGLGRVLLRAGLAHLHAHGARRVVLYVDTAAAGARALYASAGFTTASHDVCYEQDVPAAPGTAPGTGRVDLTRPA